MTLPSAAPAFSTWTALVPVVLGAAALLVVPGLLTGWALRLRGVVLLTAAPALTVALTGTTALVAPHLGLRWDAGTVAAALAVAVAAAALTGRVLPRSLRRGRADDPPRETGPVLAVVAGTLLGAAVAAATTARGLGRADVVSQGFDTIFHLNAVRWVLDTGSASPVDVGRLTSRDAASAYYPAAWHGLAALVAEHSTPVAAANALVLLVPGLAWSLSCALLVRALCGARPLPLLLAPVLAQGFVAFPWYVDRGGLWPLVLGTALVPALLGALALATAGGERVGSAPADVRWRAALVAVAAAGACGLAHPDAFFTGALLALVLLVVTVVPAHLLPWRGARAQWAVVAGTAGGAAVVAAGGWLFREQLASVARADWPATRSVGKAVVEVLTGAPAGAGSSWVVAALVLLGAVRAARDVAWRWLVVGHVVVGALDVLAAAVDAPVSQLLTGLWYNDRGRLAASLPVTGTALAVLGVLWAADALRRRAVRAALATAAALAAVVAQVGGSAAQLAKSNADAAEDPRTSLVTLAEQRFLEGLRRYVPEGAVVAGNPWDGSSFAYALSGVPVLYPHLRGNFPQDWVFLADHLQDAGTDPAVCAALGRTGVRYVLDDGQLWRPPKLEPAGYTAFRLFQGRPGFVEVASGGGVTLYEITACDR
ncbi:DUF6541 family protein [Kineococcus aurantiacus]|uniref:Uncharacterized protein n=1 Tax=Kineococcus aurantiacus TaxID=37633 RepID=A0A7Y9DMN7_9ACTN|nr:DUF6541 family protein [Kineococcus aurantiacus]NYD23400.1 hypothetical protein [Kineococcus aurantiacus]